MTTRYKSKLLRGFLDNFRDKSILEIAVYGQDPVRITEDSIELGEKTRLRIIFDDDTYIEIDSKAIRYGEPEAKTKEEQLRRFCEQEFINVKCKNDGICYHDDITIMDKCQDIWSQMMQDFEEEDDELEDMMEEWDEGNPDYYEDLEDW